MLLCGVSVVAASAATLDEGNQSGGMKITTVIPSTHTITIINEDGGAEVIYGTAVGTEFTAPRLSDAKVVFRAKSGYAIKSVKLGDTEITLTGGSYTIKGIYENQTFTVVTERTKAPNDITYTVKGKVTQNGKPAADITLELRSDLKTVVTGSDGTFHFEKVESGHHSLTAIKDGKIVGYTELELINGSVELNFTVADNGVTEIKVPDGTATIDLTLDLTDDGDINITDVDASKAPTPPGASQTGDDSNMMLWFSLMIISIAAVTIIGIARWKRKAV